MNRAPLQTATGDVRIARFSRPAARLCTEGRGGREDELVVFGVQSDGGFVPSGIVVAERHITGALKMVKQTGYGVVTPSLSDMKLDTPEITTQGSRFGVKLKAKAASIHMIRVDVNSTFEPIIGSEVQSKELIDHIMKDKENDPDSIWKSEIFGRSLDVIVQEGIQSKLSMMPDNIRFKLQNTLTKIVNKGSNNMIAFVL